MGADGGNAGVGGLAEGGGVYITGTPSNFTGFMVTSDRHFGGVGGLAARAATAVQWRRRRVGDGAADGAANGGDSGVTVIMGVIPVAGGTAATALTAAWL